MKTLSMAPVLALFLACSAFAGESAPDMYQKVKEVEAIFPIPRPLVDLDIGSFDGSTGNFRARTFLT